MTEIGDTNKHEQWPDFIRRHFDERGITLDAEQASVVEQLQGLSERLRDQSPTPRFAWMRRALRQRKTPPRSPFGIYLWGNVGSGKTLILELFYQFLPRAAKRHFHFHRFMRMVHQQRRNTQQNTDPFAFIAENLRDHLVFLDEFLVNDIGDAMLLKGLLESMRACGASLLVTSNTPPDALYEGGLQRRRFLPAIEFIKSHLAVIALDSATDYRTRLLRALGTYHTPCDADSDKAMRAEMEALSLGKVSNNEHLTVNGRSIPTVQASGNAVWFSFKTLCETPRATGDYIQIACDYPTVLLSGVPKMDGRNDLARRFIHLIDVIYDHRVKLIVSAETPAAQLYSAGQLSGEFERTVSRLVEINSEAYLSSRHKRHIPETQ